MKKFLDEARWMLYIMEPGLRRGLCTSPVVSSCPMSSGRWQKLTLRVRCVIPWLYNQTAACDELCLLAQEQLHAPVLKNHVSCGSSAGDGIEASGWHMAGGGAGRVPVGVVSPRLAGMARLSPWRSLRPACIGGNAHGAVRQT
jgi:hypothetical protein